MHGMDVLSGIRDNHKRGAVGDFLWEKIQSGSKLSFVSAYFTIKDEADFELITWLVIKSIMKYE